MNMLIKNAMAVMQDDIKNCDIFIKDGVIEKIGCDIEIIEDEIIEDDINIINAEGNFASAGFIDVHSHLREPGYEHKEDIVSGTESAVKGGFTTVLCMPNTNPCIDNANTVKYIYDRAKIAGLCNIIPVGAITVSQKGEQLTDFCELKDAGAVALSDDGRPVENSAVMREALIKAKQEDILIISHCEDLNLVKANAINSAEDTVTARDIILAGETGARLHIAHVSSRNSVDFVEWAKRRGYKVTAETCSHYFSLTTEDAARIGVNAKMNPPLRSEDDRNAIIEGIKSGVIDCISTDHAPHSPEEKQEKSNDFEKAMNGIIGFETAFSVGMTYLVNTGVISLNRLIELMTTKPAEIIGIDDKRGTLKEGMAADIVIFNADEKNIYSREEIRSKSRNTPYIGHELYGKILYTIVNGKKVYDCMTKQEV